MPSTASLVSSEASESSDPMGPLPTPPVAIQLRSLLGSASSEHLQTLHSLYAAQIATLVWLTEDQALVGSSRRSIIVGIALQKVANEGGGLNEREKRTFHAIMEALMGMLKQS